MNKQKIIGALQSKINDLTNESIKQAKGLNFKKVDLLEAKIEAFQSVQSEIIGGDYDQ
jgi:hypothetical protein